MASAIERRHDIGGGEDDQEDQSQNSGDAQNGRFRFKMELERSIRPSRALFRVATGLIQAPLKVLPAIDWGRRIKDCPAEFDPLEP